MASFPLLQISYPRPSTDFRDYHLVKGWYDKIAAKGYYLYERDELLTVPWDAMQNYPAEISSQVLQNITAFCQGNGDNISCDAFHLQFPEHFTFSAGVYSDLGEDKVYIDLDSGEIRNLHDNKLLIEQVELMYQHWHPLYGFLWSDGMPYTTREDALAGTFHGLYQINVFSPDLVAQIGRERLLTAPAWHVKEIDDGGIILVPSPFMADDPAFHDPKARKHVAEHIGIPFFD